MSFILLGGINFHQCFTSRCSDDQSTDKVSTNTSDINVGSTTDKVSASTDQSIDQVNTNTSEIDVDKLNSISDAKGFSEYWKKT